MRSRVIVGLLGVSMLGMSGVSDAATLYTAPLPGGGAGVYCQAVNVSAAPRDVTIVIRDANALVVNTVTCPGLAVANSCALAVPGAGVAPHSCRIDVAGGKTTVRGSIVRLNGDGTLAVALPAD